MKKAIFTALALGVGMFSQAQLLSVSAPQEVAVPQGYEVNMASLSPDGSYVVVSPLNGMGIDRLDLNDGTLKAISKSASPFFVTFSNDGSNVVYRDVQIDANMRRHVGVNAYNVAKGTTTTLVAPTRNLQGIAVYDATAMTVADGRMQAKSLNNSTAAVERPVPSIDKGMLYLSDAQGTRMLNPLPHCTSYLWPSVSPDGQRIAFYGVGYGAYTCNLDGSDLRELGALQAPVWAGNDVIVAMVNHDNGIMVTDSKVVAVKADGSASQDLTDSNVIAMWPSVATGKIAFTTPEGKLYIMNIK